MQFLPPKFTNLRGPSLRAGGEPSTKFPPEWLVEQNKFQNPKYRTQKNLTFWQDNLKNVQQLLRKLLITTQADTSTEQIETQK